MTVLDIAEQIAREAHAGQTEELTGLPYVGHLRRVVALCTDDATRAVAWLHDVLEDCPQWTAGLLNKRGIPGVLCESVILLTRWSDEPYADYIRRIARSCDQIAVAVKIADLVDHVRHETLDKLPDAQKQRYAEALDMLLNTRIRETPPDPYLRWARDLKD